MPLKKVSKFQYEDQVKKVIGCLEVLAKYCENLLNPQALRPHKWLTISLHNQIFMEKVQPIKVRQFTFISCEIVNETYVSK